MIKPGPKLEFSEPLKSTGTTHLVLPADLKAWLDAIAEKYGITRSRLIREIIIAWFEADTGTEYPRNVYVNTSPSVRPLNRARRPSKTHA